VAGPGQRPRDWKSRECAEKLRACKTREELRRTYDKVEGAFKPVLHHFFLEQFPTPQVWYERRLAYTRSVAVNSIVGRGLHTFTSQLNLSRFGHTSPCPPVL
jgi:ataxia telangiectasia mutated family protein